jgi:uncharacterized protein
MTIYVKVKPGSKHEKIEQKGEKHYIVSIKARAYEGKANIAVIEALAKYFSVSNAYVQILTGHMSKEKVIEIIK